MTQDWENDLLDETVPPPESSTQAEPSAATQPEPAAQFDSCESWVTEWLLPTFTRDIRGPNMTWCPQWQRHPEAVHRLSALWMAWEELTAKAGSGPSMWWVQHADHHLAVLLDERGPFHGCSVEGHRSNPVPQLPSEPSIPTA